MENWKSRGQSRYRRNTLLNVAGKANLLENHGPSSSSVELDMTEIPSASKVKRNVEDITMGKWLTPKEYMLIGIEAILSFSAFIIKERNFQKREQMRLRMTGREITVHYLHVGGYSTLISLVIGCLADSHVSHYTMAVFSVIIHFIGASMILIERTGNRNWEDSTYAAVLSKVNDALLLLIASTNFTRLIYGLKGMRKKKKSTVHIFIFLQYWVSGDATTGGIFQFFYVFTSGKLIFIGTGLCLFLFLYALPALTDDNEDSETSRDQRLPYKVIQCLTLATLYKILRIRLNKGFFSNTEGTVDKITVSKARNIIVLYTWLLPTFGLIFINTFDTQLFIGDLLNSYKTGPVTGEIGLLRTSRVILLLAMPLSYFGIWPLLVKIGMPNKAIIKLLMGYLLSIVTFLILALLYKLTDELPASGNHGWVRIFNNRMFSVRLTSEEQAFTKFEEVPLQPKDGITFVLHCNEPRLFSMKLLFNGTDSNFTTLLAVVPGETMGYILLDPPQVTRIRGPFLPVHQGPPGTNKLHWSRIYIYNTASVYQSAHVRITQHGELLRDFELGMSIMTTAALPYGTYDIEIGRTGLKKTTNFGQGGIYGVFIHATTVTTGIDVDTVVKPASSSAVPFLLCYFFWGLAHGIAYPTLRGIIFDNAPEGLVATSFSFLTFLEGLCAWIQFIGFKTWHYYVNSNAVIAYSVMSSFSFFICAFAYIKYNSIFK